MKEEYEMLIPWVLMIVVVICWFLLECIYVIMVFYHTREDENIDKKHLPEPI